MSALTDLQALIPPIHDKIEAAIAQLTALKASWEAAVAEADPVAIQAMIDALAADAAALDKALADTSPAA